MGNLKTNSEVIIEAYNKGESFNSIARRFGTYPTSIKRILEKWDVTLRHDIKQKGEFYVEDGDKLIEWAKSQGRLVTKSELAAVIGKKKLSHSYFEKYPELGKYIKNTSNIQLQKYIKQIADWLNKNNIQYKPSDRTKLGVSVDFLLLGKYSNIALQIMEKPSNVSQSRHEEEMSLKSIRAKKAGICIIFLTETELKNLNKIKTLLNDIKS